MFCSSTIARKAHPYNRRHQAKFVLALRHLRREGKWVLDKDAPAPKWANPVREVK